MKKRWGCLLLCLLLLPAKFCRTEEPWVLAGYLYLEKIHTAQDLKDIHFAGLTHVNLAFAEINQEYLPVVNEGLQEKIRWVQQEMQEQGATGKVVLSIGGWGCDGLCYAAQDEAHREAFALECRRLVEEYRLDGVDIDWEYPVHGAWGTIDTLGEADRRNYTLLLETLRRILGEENG